MEGHDKTIYGAMYAPLSNSFRRHCVAYFVPWMVWEWIQDYCLLRRDIQDSKRERCR